MIAEESTLLLLDRILLAVTFSRWARESHVAEELLSDHPSHLQLTCLRNNLIKRLYYFLALNAFLDLC